jgi:hypothetical protein
MSMGCKLIFEQACENHDQVKNIIQYFKYKLTILAASIKSSWTGFDNFKPGNRSEIIPLNKGMSLFKNLAELTSKIDRSINSDSSSSGNFIFKLPAAIMTVLTARIPKPKIENIQINNRVNGLE